MLETSKDLFFIALSFCVLMVTFFTCWILFYVVSMFRKADHIISGVKKKMDLIDEILKTIREKVEHSASAILLLVKGVEELLDFLKTRKNKKDKG